MRTFFKLLILGAICSSPIKASYYQASQVLGKPCDIEYLRKTFATKKAKKIEGAQIQLPSLMFKFFTKEKDAWAISEDRFLSPPSHRPSKVFLSTFHSGSHNITCRDQQKCFEYFWIGFDIRYVACLDGKVQFFSFRDDSDGNLLTRFMNNKYGLPLKRLSVQDQGIKLFKNQRVKKITHDRYSYRQKDKIAVVIGSHSGSELVLDDKQKPRKINHWNGYHIMYSTEKWINYLIEELKARKKSPLPMQR